LGFDVAAQQKAPLNAWLQRRICCLSTGAHAQKRHAAQANEREHWKTSASRG
jgi:hypothetical protein